MTDQTPFDFIQSETRTHQRHHGCGAYTFEDGPGLISLVQEHRPLRVLELGTALGFTACCLASAFEKTTVDTVELDPEHVELARQNIHAAKLDARIKVHQGEFHQVMSGLEKGYNLAFFDGSLPGREIVTDLRALLAPDGILVCANLIWAGGAIRRALDAELTGSGRWSPLGEIENGGTQIFRKAG